VQINGIQLHLLEAFLIARPPIRVRVRVRIKVRFRVRIRVKVRVRPEGNRLQRRGVRPSLWIQ